MSNVACGDVINDAKHLTILSLLTREAYLTFMINGFLLGLSNNLFCFLSCAAVFIPYAIASNQKPFKSVMLFMSGRLLAYVFFGFAAGYTSLYFDGRIDPLIFAVFNLLMSVWLILFAVGRLNFKPGICGWLGKRFQGKNFPLLLGVTMGLNICPPFLLGLSETLQMASILKPVAFFLGFYIGSSLWLVLFLFTGKLFDNKFVRAVGILSALIAGLYFLVKSSAQLAYFIF